MAAPVSAANGITRRNFYTGAIYAIWALMTAALGLPALVYLFLPPKIKRRQDWTEVGSIASLTANTPVEVAFRKNRIDGWKVTSEKSTAWILKRADNSVVAYGPQCTHLGCAYHWDEGKHEFLCPCHNSIFAMDGKVVSGPAPRPLDRYDVRVEGDKLLVGALRQERS